MAQNLKVRNEKLEKEKQEKERLRALKENNEEEYFRLLKSGKNTRLMQLLNQTDSYLQQIGELASSCSYLQSAVNSCNQSIMH